MTCVSSASYIYTFEETKTKFKVSLMVLHL